MIGMLMSAGANEPSFHPGNAQAKAIVTANAASEPKVATHFASLLGANAMSNAETAGTMRRR
jgi:hypothetical protein